MLTKFLKCYAPSSLHLIFNPVDTGSPNHDFNIHLEQFGNKRDTVYCPNSNNRQHFITGNIARIDLESIQVIGGRVLGHLESDLGPVDEAEQQHKILSVPYAEKKLGNVDDAIEFVRVIKQAVTAGVEADTRSLQIWASWGYSEVSERYARLLRDNSEILNEIKNTARHAELLAEFQAAANKEVLSELAIIAIHLTAVTATNEERLLDEPEIYQILPREERLTPTERKELFEARCSEVLDHHDTRSTFASELTSICSRIGSPTSSASPHDDDAQFQSYLTDLADSGNTSYETLEALQESHERVTEQYSEGGVVSLHMSDAERFVVDGTLDDDVTSDYLPPDARSIANEMLHLFMEGEDFQTIDTFIELRLNQIYGDPSDKANRVTRTMRGVRTRPMTTHAGNRETLFEYTYPVSAYPNREERQYAREVLDILFEAMQQDFILRSMNRSAHFRRFHNLIDDATDVRQLIDTIKDAYQSRLRRTITIKMFTALNTLYVVKRARLQSTLLRVTKTINGSTKLFEPALPLIALAKTIAPRDLRTLATNIHTLPQHERERVRHVLRTEQPQLYDRILNGLQKIVRKASPDKRRYLRFAFYQDHQTGVPNQSHNLIHLLTASDNAVIWQQVKEPQNLTTLAA